MKNIIFLIDNNAFKFNDKINIPFIEPINYREVYKIQIQLWKIILETSESNQNYV